jgi:hypothetical protein
MIVECYSADVYCDCVDHLNEKSGAYFPVGQFCGPNKRNTDKQRRDAGWIKVKGQDICPECKTRKPLRINPE